MKFDRQAFHPSPESLKAIANAAKEISPKEDTLLEWHDSYVSNQKKRIAFDLEIAKSHIKPNAEVLEVGSVPLLFTFALSRENFNVTGCDIFPDRYLEVINKIGIQVAKCDIENEALPFADETFDGIVFNEVFEHLRINPIFTLSEIFRVLKPGGILILSSPNLRSLKGIYNFLVKNKSFSSCENTYEEYKKLETLGHMGHVREYTTKEVTEFLERIGFQVSRIIYRGTYERKIRQVILKMLPSLRPYVSYIANKPEKTPLPGNP